MRSTLEQSQHTRRLGELSAYGVQELTEQEAMTTNGGALPLFAVIAAIVGADAAFMALGFGMMALVSSNSNDNFCPAY